MTESQPWRVRPVATEEDWLRAREIRQRVFVEEQDCPPEEEWDEHDWDGATADARHFLLLERNAKEPGDGEALGTARWRRVTWREHPAAKLERFAVLPAARGRGGGRALVEHLLADARGTGLDTFLLHAQAYLEEFYAAWGFAVDPRDPEARFLEAGIPHSRMVLREPKVP